ncbi:hypothetical protein [Actinoplanes regularis]|uniref:hypothetical protein n=1 Tax=Actinoplanes regularis TaxID=52697 RepID=UPI0011778EDB|nr:hypothetical protein [Actinoplanes regularis]
MVEIRPPYLIGEFYMAEGEMEPRLDTEINPGRLDANDKKELGHGEINGMNPDCYVRVLMPDARPEIAGSAARALLALLLKLRQSEISDETAES